MATATVCLAGNRKQRVALKYNEKGTEVTITSADVVDPQMTPGIYPIKDAKVVGLITLIVRLNRAYRSLTPRDMQDTKSYKRKNALALTRDLTHAIKKGGADS